MQSLKSNDIPVAIKDDNVEVRTMEVGEMPARLLPAPTSARRSSVWTATWARALTGAACSRVASDAHRGGRPHL